MNKLLGTVLMSLSSTDVSVQPQPFQAEAQWQSQEVNASTQFYSGSYPAPQPVGALSIQCAVE